MECKTITDQSETSSLDNQSMSYNKQKININPSVEDSAFAKAVWEGTSDAPW